MTRTYSTETGSTSKSPGPDEYPSQSPLIGSAPFSKGAFSYLLVEEGWRAPQSVIAYDGPRHGSAQPRTGSASPVDTAMMSYCSLADPRWTLSSPRCERLFFHPETATAVRSPLLIRS